MKKVFTLIGEVYVTVKLLGLVYRIGEKKGEDKTYSKIGKEIIKSSSKAEKESE